MFTTAWVGERDKVSFPFLIDVVVFSTICENISGRRACACRVAGIGGGGWLLEVTHLEVT